MKISFSRLFIIILTCVSFLGCFNEQLKTRLKGHVRHYKTLEPMRNFEFKILMQNYHYYDLKTDENGDYTLAFDWDYEYPQSYIGFENTLFNFYRVEASPKPQMFHSPQEFIKIRQEEVNLCNITYFPVTYFNLAYEDNSNIVEDSVYVGVYINSPALYLGYEKSTSWNPIKETSKLLGTNFILHESAVIQVTQKIKIQGQSTMQVKNFTYTSIDNITTHTIKYE